MAEAGELGLNAISFAVDKVPDSYFDYVPGVGPPKSVRQQRKREQKEQSRQSRSRRNSTPAQPQSRPQQPYKNDEHSHGLSQDNNAYPADSSYPDQTRGSRGRSYDESIPLSNSSPDYSSPRDRPSRAPMTSDQYYPGSDYYDQQRRSYNPSNYLPPDEYYRGGGGSTYGRESSYLPPAPRHSSRRAREDDYESDYDSRERDSRRGRSRRDRSSSRRRSKSKGGMKEKVEQSFDPSERGLTTGAIGALAGGLAGHKLGKGKIGTIAGALIGGLGANAWEARESRHKDYHNRAESPYSNRRARSSDPHAYPPDSSSRRELEPYGARGGGGDRDMGYSDDEDEEQARQRRKLERRAAKKRREAEEEERKAMHHADNEDLSGQGDKNDG